MPDQIIGPTSHYFYAQRLKLHYVDWGNEALPLAVLVHGGRDHARNWDWVALELRQHFHVVAPDLRGHGDSDWAIGGSYSMIDYVLDLAQLMSAIGTAPATFIGHSLGGGVVLQYAGVFPERVRAVIAIEGLGPPPAMIQESAADQRMRNWIEVMQALARRKVREYPTLDNALARMREANPHLRVDQARHLTIHGVRRNENGTYSWKFDNYVHATSPYLFNLKDASEIWGRIASPCLLIRGDESPWAGEPERDGRLGAFRAAQSVVIRGAGHWVHHDRLTEFLGAVRGFLKI
ncbi:MAG TPA: alpha/beta hydrolase [Candidatus Binataceae bacterium]|nr:alpha/beta hydrolase [Candidatus Binataceae bacterium]